MKLTTTADYIAAHAVMILLAVTVAMAVATAGVWHVIGRTGPPFLRWITRIAGVLSRHPVATRVHALPMVGPVMSRTLSAGRYLGIHAFISFIVALVTIAAFVELAEEIGIDEALGTFDLALSDALAVHLSDSVLRVCAVLTHLGDAWVLAGVTASIGFILLVRRRYLLACAWLVTTAAGGVLTRLLKAWFARTRPMYDHGFATADGWSFPSGHAAGSMLVYGLLGYLLVRHTHRRWHIPLVVATMILIVFIGSSRVLLQVHFFSDVLAGWASASTWLALCIAGLEAVRWRKGLSATAPP